MRSVVLASTLLLGLGCNGLPPTSAPATSAPTTPGSNAPPTVSAAVSSPTPSPSPSPTTDATALVPPPTIPPSTLAPVSCEARVDSADKLNVAPAQIFDADEFRDAVELGGQIYVAGAHDATEHNAATVWAIDGAGKVQESVFQGGTIWNLLGDDAGLMAVGRFQTQPDVADAGIWFSADGAAWTRTESPNLALNDPFGTAKFVARWRGGYVVVGAHEDDDTEVVVWLSSDGKDWQRVNATDAFASAYPTSLAVLADGTIVVGTTLCNEHGCATGAVLISADGQTWIRHSDQTADSRTTTPVLRTLVVTPSSLLLGTGYSAVYGPSGETLDESVGVWQSTDGAGWSLVAPVVGVTSLALVHGEYFVSGKYGLDCGIDGAAVWRSSDGSNWRLAWAQSHSYIDALKGVGGRLAILGGTAAGDGHTPNIWLESP